MARGPVHSSAGFRAGSFRLRPPRPSLRLLVISATLALALFAVACGNTSASLDRYHEGRTLAINIVEIVRVPELRYSTIDPEQVIRRWSLNPVGEGTELVLLRMKVENHQAVSAIVNVDPSAAILRDFVNQSYFPLNVSSNVYQDMRGEAEAVVRMDLGQCFDPNRLMAEAGTQIRWSNEGEAEHFVQFDDTAVAVGEGGRASIPPGGSVSHTIDRTGAYPYVCGTDETGPSNAEVLVVETGSKSSVRERSVLFLDGTFDLLRGTGVDGWIVFEAPVDTQFRDFRWRAGDSITIRF